MGDHNKPLIEIKTNLGKVLKAISNILHANFTSATIIIMEQGIFIQESYGRTMIFECKLERDKFLTYKIPELKNEDGEGSQIFTIGFTTKHFKEALDKIGVSDSVEVNLHPSNFEVCNIKIFKGPTSIVEKSFSLIKTTIGDIVPPIYVEHIPTCTVLASDFKSAVGSIKKSKNAMVVVNAQKQGIRIKDINSSISTNGCILGEWDQNFPPICSYTLPLTRLASFVEINSISNKETIRIYAFPNIALRLSASASTLGVINIYLDSTVPNNNITNNNLIIGN